MNQMMFSDIRIYIVHSAMASQKVCSSGELILVVIYLLMTAVGYPTSTLEVPTGTLDRMQRLKTFPPGKLELK